VSTPPEECGDPCEAKDETLAIASRFCGGPDATALWCPEVLLEGEPILCVVRKNDVGQFLCGRDHSREDITSYDHPLVRTVKEMVAHDPSVAPVATMNDRHILRRRSASEPWMPHDDLSTWWF
jgi:hypothetical protein